MSYVTVVWPDGQDAGAFGPFDTFDEADALAKKAEDEMHWHLNDPNSFAWAVEIKTDIDSFIAAYQADPDETVCPKECL